MSNNKTTGHKHTAVYNKKGDDMHCVECDQFLFNLADVEDE